MSDIEPVDYYGYKRTLQDKRIVDAFGEPIPWLTYPAIDYLKQLNFQNSTVFEYGSGASTRFWEKRAARVISVEHNREWWEKVKVDALPSTTLFHAIESEYVNKVAHMSPHDVIVIDGRWRFDCSRVALSHLSKSGLIILDNAERYPAITSYFRESGLIQIDMIGYGPAVANPWCTSLFLTRSFNFAPAGDMQPQYLHGLLDHFIRKRKYRSANEQGSWW